jgi:hypothetical protein
LLRTLKHLLGVEHDLLLGILVYVKRTSIVTSKGPEFFERTTFARYRRVLGADVSAIHFLDLLAPFEPFTGLLTPLLAATFDTGAWGYSGA